MVIAMFLAHLVGDYLLQTDKLAYWKSRQLSGVLVHCAIVTLVAWLFMLPFDPDWWLGILIIGLGHTAVDVGQFYLLRWSSIYQKWFSPLARFLLDQTVHVALISLALYWGGYLVLPPAISLQRQILLDNRWGIITLAYVFITTPSWVLIKFLSSGLVPGSVPDFSDTINKYAGILERLLITTFVATGQFLLVPLVAVPRLLMHRSLREPNTTDNLFLLEWLVSLTVAATAGLLLNQLQ